jgi:hypothetical protein
MTAAVLVTFLAVMACKNTEYSFGSIKTPQDLVINVNSQGQDANNPTGDGSGIVTISAQATNALQYKIYFGNGDSDMTYSGTATYKYTTIDTNTYTITVNAIGTGGAISTLTKQIRVLYKFQIPADIMAIVPGNGIICFGTGGTTYEILSLTSNVMWLRNIGSDGNAWYQIFRAQ